jgi:hypothetical protein
MADIELCEDDGTVCIECDCDKAMSLNPGCDCGCHRAYDLSYEAAEVVIQQRNRCTPVVDFIHDTWKVVVTKFGQMF